MQEREFKPKWRRKEREPFPNKGQRIAIEAVGQNLAVSAGAGSGKTWVLAERYIEMLIYGLTPQQIVAITFTEKAAAQMRGRIRAGIAGRLEEATESGSEEEAAFWRRCKEEVDRAAITTIHGFCSRLLRDFPAEAGVDPLFQVLDEVGSQLLLEASLDGLVESWLGEGGAGKAELYQELGSRKALEVCVRQLYEDMRTAHLSKAEVLSATRQTIEERQHRLPDVLQSLDEVCRQVERCVGELMRKTKHPPAYLLKACTFTGKWDRALSLMQSAEKEGVVRDKGKTEEREVPGDLPRDGQLYDRSFGDLWMSPAWAEVLQDLKEALWPKRGDEGLKALRMEVEVLLNEVCLLMPSPRYLGLVFELLELAGRLDTQYRQAKAERQAVDFNELEERALNLLNSPDVARVLRRRIRFLMVDEFQDTNPLQKQLVDQLTGYGMGINLFVVGDPKQSIYRFRGADVRVFYEMQETVQRSGGQCVFLEENFRTQRQLMDYFNPFFSFLMQGNERVPFQPLISRRKPIHEEPVVHLIHYDPEALGWEEEKLEEARAVASFIQKMVEGRHEKVWVKPSAPEGEKGDKSGTESGGDATQQEKGHLEGHAEDVHEKARPVRYADVAILFSATTHISLFETALRELRVPYQIRGGHSFYSHQEVLDALSLLKVLENPQEEVALAAVLRSPFFSLSDETLFWLAQGGPFSSRFYRLKEKPAEMPERDWEQVKKAREKLTEWRYLIEWEPLDLFLEQVWWESGYRHVLLMGWDGEQKVANLEKLKTLATRIVQLEPGSQLRAFVRFLEQMQEASVREEEAEQIRGDADAVQLMTVHAAKGLEFPVVVLPFLSRGLLGNRGQNRFYLSRQKGLGLKMNHEEGLPAGDGLYDELKEEDRQAELEEEKRKLYVAMTRARDLLILPVVQKPLGQAARERTGSSGIGRNQWQDWILRHLGVLEAQELPEGMIERENWRVFLHRPVARDLHGRQESHHGEAQVHISQASGEQIHRAFPEKALRMLPGETKQGKKASQFPEQELQVSSPVQEGAQQEVFLEETYPLIAPLQVTAERNRIYSASSLMRYQRCPRQYYWQYVRPLPGTFLLKGFIADSVEQPNEEFDEILEDVSLEVGRTSMGGEFSGIEEDEYLKEEVRSDRGVHPERKIPEGGLFVPGKGESLPGEVQSFSLSAAQRGNLLHRLIQFLSRVEPVARETWVKDEVTRYVQEVLLGQVPGGSAGSVDTFAVSLEARRLRKLLKTYEESRWFDIEQEAGWQVLSEQPFLYRLGDFFLQGKIDKLFVHPDGNLRILDVKSNQIPRLSDGRPDPRVLVRMREIYRLQAELYTLAVEGITSKSVLETVYFFLDSGTSLVLAGRAVDPEGERLLKAKEEMQQLLERISRAESVKNSQFQTTGLSFQPHLVNIQNEKTDHLALQRELFPTRPEAVTCSVCPFRLVCEK